MSTKGGIGVKINYHQYSKTLKQAHPIEKQWTYHYEVDFDDSIQLPLFWQSVIQ